MKFHRGITIVLYNNTAKNPATYGLVCFPREACFDDRVAVMADHTHRREKAIWVKQGESNTAYIAYRTANPLTPAKVAEDEKKGYVWGMNDGPDRPPTPLRPDTTRCRLPQH